jgi:hypothetical protein
MGIKSGWGRRVRVDLFQRTITNNSPTTTPTTWWAALHVGASLTAGNPDDDGQSVTEVTQTTSGYTRQQITGGTPTWTITVYTSVTVDTATVVGNNNALSFGPSTGANAAWGTVQTIGLWNTSGTGITEATYYGRAIVAVPQIVSGAGVTLTVAINGIQMGIISA